MSVEQPYKREVTPQELKKWILLGKPPAKLVQLARGDLPASLNDLLGLDLRGHIVQVFVREFMDHYRHSQAATEWAISELHDEGHVTLESWDPTGLPPFLATYFSGIAPEFYGEHLVIQPERPVSEWWKAELSKSESVEADNASPDAELKPCWDAVTEARNKWLYEQCRDIVPYKEVRAALGGRSEWSPISSVQGIKKAAQAYADRHGLPPIPRRKGGRPPGKK